MIDLSIFSCITGLATIHLKLKGEHYELITH